MQADYVKGAFSILPFIAAVFTHYDRVKKRHDWNTKRSRQIGFLGVTHWVIDVLPIWVYYVFAIVSILIGGLVFSNAILALQPPPPLSGVTAWADSNFEILIVTWLIVTVFFFFNWPAMALAGVGRLIPAVRRQVGYSNAYWHVFLGEEAPAVALARADGNALVDEVVTTLTKGPANRNRAVRPADLEDDEAANILFFGHVIEGVLTDGNHRWQDELWTAFYAALGDVARQPARLMSAASLRQTRTDSFFHQVLIRLTEHLPADTPEMPGLMTSAQRIDGALSTLRTRFGGDARKLGRGLFRSRYQTCLQNARTISQFGSEEICRQFAKLAVIWRIVPEMSYPATFEIPFSRSIAAWLLTKDWILTDSERFSANDQRFVAAYEGAQRQLMGAVAALVESDAGPKTKAWRDTERAFANDRGLDWSWYVQYCIDQQIYHSARLASATLKWKPEGPSIVKCD